MIRFATLLALPDSFSLLTVVVLSFGGLCFGALFRFALLSKSKRKIVRLEDEMLANHSRILSLEKKITELEHENKALKNDVDITPVREKKISERELKLS